ncbi:hypothetical protein [Phytohabitans rumicis]|uniref:Uncharacterized protein n=1 Tax=Phytohabitans rumicis TaxID=1076125 RepID=A0A6V8LMN6_9ACTN|nr:hypothetical protein [Phytohabitans rumicis]GFJ96128.1 hypothetical protein Prum_097700 [Phytohabitans rumicis]
MTTRLSQALADAAELAVRVPVPDDLWRRGRRSRRRRRAAAALACLVLAAAVAWLPVRAGTAPEPVGAGPEVLPSAVADPHLWQQTFVGDPNGPAKLVFTTGHSLNLETAVVLIGTDDSYRLIYLPPGGEPGSLSPDGRWLLRHDLLDLATGETRGLERRLTGYLPAVWAADSRTALGVVGGDGGTSYGPDGKEIPPRTRRSCSSTSLPARCGRSPRSPGTPGGGRRSRRTAAGWRSRRRTAGRPARCGSWTPPPVRR